MFFCDLCKYASFTDRTVQSLREKWWIEKNKNVDAADCDQKTGDSSENPDLDWEHVSGVFLVLSIGVATATFIGILEFFWNVRKVSVAQKVNPKINMYIVYQDSIEGITYYLLFFFQFVDNTI